MNSFLANRLSLDIQGLELLTTILSFTVTAFFAALVYFNNRKSWTNRFFVLLSIVFDAYIVINYFSLHPPAHNAESQLFWIRLVMFTASFKGPLLFLFAYTFPREKPILQWKYLFLILVSMILASVVSLSSYVFESISFKNNEPIPIPGPGMFLFVINFVGFVISSFIVLILKYRQKQGQERARLLYLLLGIIFSFSLFGLAILISVVVFQTSAFVFLAPIFLAILVIPIAYAIVKHGLFDIKILATNILVITIWISLFAQVFTAKSFTGIAVDLLTLILTIVFGIFLIRSVRKEVAQREKLQELTGQLTVAKMDLEGKNEKLRELDQLKSEFLSFASHQVKSPMAVIKGFAQLIYDGTYGQLPDEAKEKAKKIKESADRTLALVNNLLDLRKIEEGKMEFKFEDVDIVKLISDMVQEYKVIGDKKGLAMGFESSAASIKIKADQEKVRQVIQNLLDNSVKYTDKGYIKASVKDEGDKVLIAVTDSGRGMSPELLKKLFGRFVRDEQTAKEVQGTGLGLYIAKQIVTAHHGQIWIESDGEGLGSRFYVRLSKA